MRFQPLPFDCSLTKTERWLGLCFLPLHSIILPVLMGMLEDYWPTTLSAARSSTLYYLVGFLFAMGLLRKALRKDWDRLLDNKLYILSTLFSAYLLNLVLSFATALLSITLFEDSAPLVVDSTTNVAGSGPISYFSVLVFLSPIVEETLFRGVVFGSIRHRSRVSAYIASILLFALHSTWQLAATGGSETFLFFFVQCIPTAFILAWCYERTSCLWTPILFYAITNVGTLLI